MKIAKPLLITGMAFGIAISAAWANEDNTLSPPVGWEKWPLADTCDHAVELFKQRINRAEANTLSKAQWYFFERGTAVDVRDEEDDVCAMVQITGVPTAWGWVPDALLAKPTPGRLRLLAREKQTLAAQKELAARATYLRSLPTVSNGNAAIFIGADRKCSEQFVQALSMDGLEKRKKMADLVSFGCGYLVDAGVHVKRFEADAAYCRVAPAEGKQEGKPGWVPCNWVK